MKEDRKVRAGENVFCWLMLLFGLFILLQAYQISGFSSISSPGTFPMAAAAVMVVSIILTLLKNSKFEKAVSSGLKDELHQAAHQIFPQVFVVYLVVVIFYMVLIGPLHFLPSSFAFLLISMIYLRGAKAFKSLIISAVLLGFIYVMFQYFFRVVLP